MNDTQVFYALIQRHLNIHRKRAQKAPSILTAIRFTNLFTIYPKVIIVEMIGTLNKLTKKRAPRALFLSCADLTTNNFRRNYRHSHRR